MLNTYSATSIKTLRGMEGSGYNAYLTRNGKKVALVMDDASGGPLMFEWLDTKAQRVQGSFRTYQDEIQTRTMTPEEKLFNEMVVALPAEKCEYSKSGFSFPSVEIVADNLVNDALSMKRLVSVLKKKILFTQAKKSGVFSLPLTPENTKRVQAAADVGQILNNLPIDEAFFIARSFSAI